MATEKYIVEKDSKTGDVVNVEKIEETPPSSNIVFDIIGGAFEAAVSPITALAGGGSNKPSSGGTKH